jgi:hypothetical protein
LTTPPTSCVWVPRHIAWLILPLIVDYFASATHPGATSHRAARNAARRRLLPLCHTSKCLGTSRGSSRRSSSTTSPARVRPGASARHAAHRRLLRLHCTSRCLGTSRGSSRGLSRRSSSTTSPTPCVRVHRHITRLVNAARRRLLHLCCASSCFCTSLA